MLISDALQWVALYECEMQNAKSKSSTLPGVERSSFSLLSGSGDSNSKLRLARSIQMTTEARLQEAPAGSQQIHKKLLQTFLLTMNFTGPYNGPS
jgi:hypothetical protein